MIMHTKCCCFVYIYSIGFRILLNEKIFVSTECKQNISNTKEETKKENITPHVHSIKQ